ncbi:hypothetical protein A6R68_07701 [Neotoma lepida]|uniref:Uncharacterized protein n=1 Tax=Neotoma lepida TaxID=56216 RepID=A0A1A6GBZ6_NEOLE|nr:hypothetical protein A6R68_07701 [Neotoma lepida]
MSADIPHAHDTDGSSWMRRSPPRNDRALNTARARRAGESSGSPARRRIRRLPQLCAPGSLRSRSIGSEPLRG